MTDRAPPLPNRHEHSAIRDFLGAVQACTNGDLVLMVERLPTGQGRLTPAAAFRVALQDGRVDESIRAHDLAYQWLNYHSYEPNNPDPAPITGTFTGSREAQHDEDAPDPDAGFRRAAVALDLLNDRTVLDIRVEPITGDLHMDFEGDFLLRTFVSDPADDEIWHIRDNSTKGSLNRDAVGFAIETGGVKRLRYDIDRIEEHARELGFCVGRPSADEVTVTILGDAVLAFENLPEEPDTVMGFLGTPWHSHDNLVLTLDESRYEEFEATELLSALRSGEVVVVEGFLNSALEDRWVQHKLEPLDLKYVGEGEQLRVHRLP